jgi:hypothetical protein
MTDTLLRFYRRRETAAALLGGSRARHQAGMSGQADEDE